MAEIGPDRGAETLIDGFSVEIDDGQELINCYVHKDNYSASLACLQNTGELSHNHNDRTLKVSDSTIARIEQWADEHGYSD